MLKNKIYLPNQGNYTEPLLSFIKEITASEVITDETISEDYISKIKRIIIALNHGAYYIINIETNDITRYYYLLATEILEKKGYNFKFINLIGNNHLSLKIIYEFAKLLNDKISIVKLFIKYIRLYESIYLIDRYGQYIRKENLKLLNDMNLIKLISIKFYYYKKYKHKNRTN